MRCPLPKNELHCPVKIVVSVSLFVRVLMRARSRARLLYVCVCVCLFVCVFVCKTTNNLRSLRSSLIWYYYFRCSSNETLLCNSIMLKYIMAHHHPFFVFSTLCYLFHWRCFCCCYFCWRLSPIYTVFCFVHKIYMRCVMYIGFIHTLIAEDVALTVQFSVMVCMFSILDAEFIWLRVESWRFGAVACACAYACVLDKRQNENSIMRTQTNT